MSSPSPSLIHEVVRAGAGAGKTTRLTEKVIEVALDHHRKHGSYPRMILTTFTRKATGEIRERLMKLALKKQSPGLFDYVNSNSQLHISTIHGVLSSYLTNYGSRIGLNPNFQLISASKNQQLIKSQMRESMIALPETQNFLELYTFGQLCEIAESYYELWCTSLPQALIKEDFLQVIRSKQAALAKSCQSMVQALSSIEIEGAWLEWTSRLSLMAERFSKLGFEEARAENLKELEQLGNKPRRSKKNPVPEDVDENLKALLVELKSLREPRFDPESWQSYWDTVQKMKPLLEHFSKSLENQKIIDGELVMADMELLAFSVLRQAPETASSFAAEWHYWFIDEYQDTSPNQVKLLDALSASAPSFVVGDPQQSIYLFRGARSEVFAEREEQVVRSGGQHSQLLKNYRSKPELLEFFNHYFTSYSKQFGKMEPREVPQEQAGAVVAEVLISYKNENEEDLVLPEVRSIVQKIQSLSETEKEPSEIAVLARTNRQLEMIADYARAVGIPYQLHAASGYYQRLEIKDAFAILKFIVNPHDNVNMVRLLRSPWYHLNDEALAQALATRVESSYWTFLQEKLKGHETLNALLSLRQRSLDVGISEAFREALISRQFFEASDLYDPSGRRESNLWKLIAKLKNEEKKQGFNYLEFINQTEGPAFLEKLDDEADAVPVIEPRKVNLMTVHASKGLQFNHVIIAFTGKSSPSRGGGLFSSSDETAKWSIALPDSELKYKQSLVAEEWRQQMQEREQKEQERLLYVAMTRAKESVTLTWTEPFDKESWAAHCPLNRTLGEHGHDLFSYRVREEDWAAKGQAEIDKERITARLSYRRDDVEDRIQVSVTELTEGLHGLIKNATFSDPGETEKVLKKQIGHFEAVETGVRLHRLFELLRYSPEFRWDSLIEAHFPQAKTEARKALDYVSTLQAPPFIELIHSGKVEWGFTCEIDGIWLQGQIDLWGIGTDGKLWVIDYKTGAPSYKDKAFDQLLIYCVGLAEMKMISEDQEIGLAVIYPFHEKVYTENLKISDEQVTRWRKRLSEHGNQRATAAKI